MSGKTAAELFDEPGAGTPAPSAKSAAEMFAEDPTEHPSPGTTTGGPRDAILNAANVAVLGAGPQIEGLMGAAMAAHPTSADKPPPSAKDILDAYRSIRDMGAKEHEASANTLFGKAAAPIGMLATPVPGNKLAPTASVGERAAQGALVGAGVGGLQGAINTKTDLTRPDWLGLKQALGDTAAGIAGGGAGGALMGGAMAAGEAPLRSAAETQALKAAGLRGGIANQMQKKLGLSTEEEGRQLGRKFLDAKLIPFAGSKESVANRAEELQGEAGDTIGALLKRADASGKPFDYTRNANAALQPYNDATAVAQMAGGKSLDLADALEAQGKMTPGSFQGANRAKSDAWKSARFDEEAPMAAQLYRQSVGGSRNDIEEQVRAVLGDNAANALNIANERYGVGADALKLARNAGTRDQANSSVGMRELLAGIAGTSAGGPLAGFATAGAANWSRKHGNAALARMADAAAQSAAENTGGNIGGRVGGSLLDKYFDDNETRWSSLKGKP